MSEVQVLRQAAQAAGFELCDYGSDDGPVMIRRDGRIVEFNSFERNDDAFELLARLRLQTKNKTRNMPAPTEILSTSSTYCMTSEVIDLENVTKSYRRSITYAAAYTGIPYKPGLSSDHANDK